MDSPPLASNLPYLPDEMWLQILGWLPLRNKVMVSGVCKRLQKLVACSTNVQPAYRPVNIFLKGDDGAKENNLKAFPSLRAEHGESLEEAQYETLTMNAKQAEALFSKYAFMLADVRLHCDDNLDNLLGCLRAVERHNTGGTTLNLYDVTSTAEFKITKDFIELLPATLTGLWLPDASFNVDVEGDEAFSLFIEKYSMTLKKFSVDTIYQKHLRLLAGSCTNLVYLNAWVEDGISPTLGLLYLSSLTNLEHLSIGFYYIDDDDEEPDLLQFLSALTKLRTLDLCDEFWSVSESEISFNSLLSYCPASLNHLNIINFPKYLEPLQFERLAQIENLLSLGIVTRQRHDECNSCLELVQLSSSLRNIFFHADGMGSPCKRCVIGIARALNEKAKLNEKGETFCLGLETYGNFTNEYFESKIENRALNFIISIKKLSFENFDIV